jgi:NTP pyrophosphatase (non-canonical NTP hydrolase)
VEELADTMDQVLILCGKFDVDPEKLMMASEKKLRSRFQKNTKKK